MRILALLSMFLALPLAAQQISPSQINWGSAVFYPPTGTDLYAYANANCPAQPAACTLKLALGSYTASGPLTEANLTIEGSGEAAYPSSATDVTAFQTGTGTIIDGNAATGVGLALTGGSAAGGGNLTVENLSIDVGSSSPGCISASNGLVINNTGTSYFIDTVRVSNVSVLQCTTATHGMLLAANNMFLNNLTARGGEYGVVAGYGQKVNWNGGNISQTSSSGFIVKASNASTPQFPQPQEVNISNIVVDDASAISTIFAESVPISDINLTNFVMNNTQGLAIETSGGVGNWGTIENIDIDNFICDDTATNHTFCLEFGGNDGSGGGTIGNILLSHVQSLGPYIGMEIEGGATAAPITVHVSDSIFTNDSQGGQGEAIESSATNLYLDAGNTFGTSDNPYNNPSVVANAGTITVSASNTFADNQPSPFSTNNGAVVKNMQYPTDAYYGHTQHFNNISMDVGVATPWTTNLDIARDQLFNNGTVTSGKSVYYYANNAEFDVGTDYYNCGPYTIQGIVWSYAPIDTSTRNCLMMLDATGLGRLFVRGSVLTPIVDTPQLTLASNPNTSYPCNIGGSSLPLGTLAYYSPGSGTADSYEVCTLNADGTSSWKSILSSTSFITSLTTTGTSGAATVTSGVLNIPQYSGGGGSGTVNSGSGYALPAYGSSASTTVGPSNITTDSSGNNLNVPGAVTVPTLNLPTGGGDNVTVTGLKDPYDAFNVTGAGGLNTLDFNLISGDGGSHITMRAQNNALLVGNNSGNFAIFTNTLDTFYVPIATPQIIGSGTTFTLSTNTCSGTSLVGGATAGSFASGTTGTCTVTVTFGSSATAPNSWECSVHDVTTPADVIQETGLTTTTATFSGTTVSGDSIHFACTAF